MTRRNDELVGSISDSRDKTVAFFVHDIENNSIGFMLLGSTGFTFSSADDIDEFIDMLNLLKDRLFGDIDG